MKGILYFKNNVCQFVFLLVSIKKNIKQSDSEESRVSGFASLDHLVRGALFEGMAFPHRVNGRRNVANVWGRIFHIGI